MKALIFVSCDEEYAESVVGTLSREVSGEYKLEVITDMDYLNSYLETSHKIDTLILDEKLRKDFSNQAVSHLFIVTETDMIGADIISKYAGAQGILKILGSKYLRRRKGSEQNSRTTIHDIVSISDTEIKTVAALTIAGQLVKFGRKVLYLSADNLQDFNYAMPEKECYSEEDHALIINAVSKGITGELSKLIKNNGFDYVPQFRHLLSSYGMTSSTIFRFAEIIRRLDIYDEIVIEHPYGFSADSITRLANSKSTIIITSNKDGANRKLEKLLDNTREITENSLLVMYSENGKYEINESEKSMYGVNICEKIKDVSGSIEDLIENKVLRDTAEALL
ncbi:hypothetical protein D6856_13980 [Butyrivibrio sp. XB500-5]|uniref:hypothetical protein n=1 Tax=Butyrivibrio sp. XB500-5 TaxID=2364880 RepID=UPI000EA8EE65|nr:hypothetical protein [Butyrivibrio sp. XB500-5]RKM57760.1 hypothetical protein D6856_13980 [Butyrivibrio sp. XB500-5]